MKTILKEIILSNQKLKFNDLITRDLKLPLDTQKIISVVGVRRSGKTYILFDTMIQLMERGIKKEQLVFINFEDERLSFDTMDMDLILQAYRELYPEIPEDTIYFFFDEIQNIHGWEKFIRRVYDSVSKKIFISGSNSSFLARDIATSLRGRTLTYEVFPFSFSEYVRFSELENNPFIPRNKAILINSFKEYLQKGGFPETIKKDDRVARDILRNYFYVMLYKDLIERYNISSPLILKYLIEKLAANVTSSFAVNKIFNELKSQGYALSKNTLYDFLSYIDHVYLAFKINKFDFSLLKRNASEKKIYFIDTGLLNMLVLNTSKDWGKLFESAVFIELRRRYGDFLEPGIFFYKNKRECDFIVVDADKNLKAIQVSFSVNDKETLDREISGLKLAMTALELREGFILTMEDEFEMETEVGHIKVVPAWKAFLDKKLF